MSRRLDPLVAPNGAQALLQRMLERRHAILRAARRPGRLLRMRRHADRKRCGDNGGHPEVFPAHVELLRRKCPLSSCGSNSHTASRDREATPWEDENSVPHNRLAEVWTC